METMKKVLFQPFICSLHTSLHVGPTSVLFYTGIWFSEVDAWLGVFIKSGNKGKDYIYI